jgi:hypothetical protein
MDKVPKIPKPLETALGKDHDSDETVGTPAEVDGLPEEEEADASTSFADSRNPRIYIPRELAQRVVRLGIPNEAGPVGRVICALADQSISLGQGWLPNLADVVAVQTAIEHRMKELSVIQLGIMKMLAELETATEHNSLLNTFNA